MQRIVALDPGGTTGWAMWEEGPLTLQSHSTSDRFNCGQIGPDEHHKQLWDFLGTMQTHDFTIVCESFEFRQGKQRHNINLMSKEYIGVAKLFAAERMDTPVVFQTAALGKGFVSDAKLKAMGLYHPGHKHAMDAIRHLVYYMVIKEHRRDLIESWKDL